MSVRKTIVHTYTIAPADVRDALLSWMRELDIPLPDNLDNVRLKVLGDVEVSYAETENFDTGRRI